MRKTFAWNYYKATGIFLSPESFQSCVALHHLPLYRREAETDGKGRSAEPFPSGKGRQWEEADPAFGEHAGGDQRVLGRLGKKRCLFRQVDCLLTEMEELTENFKQNVNFAADRGSSSFLYAFLFCFRAFFFYDQAHPLFGDEALKSLHRKNLVFVFSAVFP